MSLINEFLIVLVSILVGTMLFVILMAKFLDALHSLGKPKQ